MRDISDIEYNIWYCILLFAFAGQTAEAIEEQENLVTKSWNELKQKSEMKRRKLKDSLELHNINNSVLIFYSFFM